MEHPSKIIEDMMNKPEFDHLRSALDNIINDYDPSVSGITLSAKSGEVLFTIPKEEIKSLYSKYDNVDAQSAGFADEVEISRDELEIMNAMLSQMNIGTNKVNRKAAATLQKNKYRRLFGKNHKKK